MKFKVRVTLNDIALNNPHDARHGRPDSGHAQTHIQVSIFGPNKWWWNLSHSLFHIISAHRSAASAYGTISRSKIKRRCDWIVQKISSCLSVSFSGEVKLVNLSLTSHQPVLSLTLMYPCLS